MSRIEELEKRLAADPNSRIFVQLAEEYRKQGLLENAIEICEEGLKKHPQYPSARVALGRALLESESFERASEEFEAVLAQVPDNILANKFLGETYHRLGRLDEAIQKYQIAQTLAPEDTELEGKIEAVRAELVGGAAGPSGAPPPSPEPAPAPASAVAPPPPRQPTEGLDPTLHDAQPAQTVAEPPPPSVPQRVPQEEAGAPVPEPEEPEKGPEEDLAPIPLVDVDEPMVLEGPAYARLGESPPESPSSESAPAVDEELPTVDEAAYAPEDVFEAPPPVGAPIAPPGTAASAPPAGTPPRPVETPPAPMAEPPAAPDAAEPVDTVEPAGGQGTSQGQGTSELETATLAELYASQGHFERAIAVYENLIARGLDGGQYRERIEELQMLAQAAAESPAPRGGAPSQGSEGAQTPTIELLEGWLDAIRRSRRD